MAIKKINTDLQIEAGLLDGDGNSGNSNQILISTGTGIDWVDGSGSSIIGGPYLPLSAGASYPLTGDLLTSGNIYLNNNKTIFGKNTSGSSYGLLTITSGNVIKLGAYAYTSAATQIGLGDNGSFLIGSSTVMKIDSSGNVGIGTSPGEKLDVAGNIRLSGNVINASNTAYYLDLDGTSRLNHGIFTSTLSFGNFSTGIQGTLFEGYSTHSVVRTDSARLDFYMGKTTTGVGTMMSLTDTGRVGIGTTSPDATLDIENSNGVTVDINSSSGDGQFRFQDNGITKWAVGRDNTQQDFVFSSSAGLSTDPVVVLKHSTGNVGIGTTGPVFKLDVHNSGSCIRHYGDSNNQLETFCFGNYQTLIATNGTVTNEFGYAGGNFYVQTNDEERIRILNDGKVGIGTTSPSQNLHVVGISGATTGLQIINSHGSPTINAYYSAFTTSAALYVGTPFSGLSCNASAFNITSDYRLKENIIELTGAISKIKNLRPVRFNYKNKEETINGFIAHEVQDVVPEAVTGEKDALYEDGKEKYQGLDNGKLVPLLTAALQEAITKIEQLETRIQTLENNN